MKDTDHDFIFLDRQNYQFLDIFRVQISGYWKNIKTKATKNGDNFSILRHIIIRLVQYYILVIQITPIF